MGIAATFFSILLSTFAYAGNMVSTNEQKIQYLSDIDPAVSASIKEAVAELVEIVQLTPPADIPEALVNSRKISKLINSPGLSRVIPRKITISERNLQLINQQVTTSGVFMAEDRMSTSSADLIAFLGKVESRNSYLYALPFITKSAGRNRPPTFSADFRYTRIPGEILIRLSSGERVRLEDYPISSETRLILDRLRRWISFEEMFHMLELRAVIDQNLTFSRPVNNLLARTGLPASFSERSPFFEKWNMSNSTYHDPQKIEKIVEKVAPGLQVSDLANMAELTVYLMGKRMLPQMFEDSAFHEMIIHNHADMRLPDSKLYEILLQNRSTSQECNNLMHALDS